MADIHIYFNYLYESSRHTALLQFVLFGFMNNLASHLARSHLIHSYGYESAGDRATCLARLFINSKSFVQYAG